MLNGGASQFVPKCPLLSRFVPVPGPKGQGGQKRTNGDKTGHFGTNWETPPFSIYPHLALLNNCRAIALTAAALLKEERGTSFVGERRFLGGILRDILGEGIRDSKIAARQWGVNLCREALGCLAELSGEAGPNPLRSCVFEGAERTLTGPKRF